MTSNHSTKRRSLNQFKMSDNYFSSPIENADLFGFDDASYHNDNPLSAIDEARLLQFDQEWDEIARQIIESQEALFTQEDDKSGTQFSPSQVEDFLQTSSPVEISTLEKDDQKCSICMSEYVKERGDTNKPAMESEQGLLGEDAPENPIKLPCGHVFGEWCIKAWLLKQRASCPVCRFQFRPVR